MIVKTPGVYIKEQRTLPASIAGVSTAVPLFIGFTQNNHSTAERISSLAEFQAIFGAGYSPSFKANVTSSGVEVFADRRFFLYDVLHMYFLNGGGPCYIQSAGTYATPITQLETKLDTVIDEIDQLDEVTLVFAPDLHAQHADNTNNKQVSSLDGVGAYSTLVSKLINTCALEQDKFAVLDFHSQSATTAEMRNWVTPDANKQKYGALYYPWLVSSDTFNVQFDSITGYTSAASQGILDLDNDLSLFGAEFTGTDMSAVMKPYADAKSAFDSTPTRAKLKTVFVELIDLIKSLEDLESNTGISAVLSGELTTLKTNSFFIAEVQKLIRLIGLLESETANGGTTSFIGGIGNPSYPSSSDWYNYVGANPVSSIGNIEGDNAILDIALVTGKTRVEAMQAFEQGQYVDHQRLFGLIAGIARNLQQRKTQAEADLFATDATYGEIKSKIQKYMSELPAQGAMAGIYCRNDRDRGVWKSPANMIVQGIKRPMVEVSNSEQDDLNVDVNSGKSINVIRTFTGKGPVVWGARTLDGESLEWRYIAVRRFFNFAEESIKKSLEHFVFEPNNARTWVKIKAMVTSFLVDHWKAGALNGTKPEEAFFVRVDETTTTQAEILQGIVNIEIGMAVARPAEFIVIEFSHQTRA